ncbi:MAG: hypothetical protein J6N46_02720, partial [Bacteroidales bacterium]|nr:hypothetical protein [Bacteroidales bacterium]
FVPALWLGDRSVIAYSESGCEGKIWTIPEGVKLSGKAKGWILDVSGRQEFKDFSVRKGAVTLTLAPGQMVLITD